jgi:hypothetical protein
MRGRALALLVALGASTAPAGESAPAWVGEARSAATTLGSELQQALASAIARGGPVAGIEVCSIRAQQIAANVSGDVIRVGRTALKVRNPENAPDPWEADTLREFERRLAAGEPPAGIEAFAIRGDGPHRYGHWMKAIPTQGLCTACHGTDIPPEVDAAIDAAYPRDQARGFSVGELRGAFSVEVDLD